MLKSVVVIACATLVGLGCGERIEPVGPQEDARLSLIDGGVSPNTTIIGCEMDPECSGVTDPSPTAPGYWLGSSVTPDACFFNEMATDGDMDDLADYCEEILAWRFRPEMRYASGDYVAREPRWVARRHGPDRVLVAYLFAYYRDLGSNAWGCPVPGRPDLCASHVGDSELLVLRIRYSDGTQHWITEESWFSQHGEYEYARRDQETYPTMSFAGNQLEYPDRPGGYLRTYVALRKHANYYTVASCNAGGTFGSDTCVGGDTSVRLEAGSYANLGSRSSPFIDCIVAEDPQHPYYGSGREECFWTDTQWFRGWFPESVGGPTADPYNAFLAGFGF